MELLPGYTLVKLTDTEIVQEKKFGRTGIIRHHGNPNPDPVKHKELLEDIYEFLYSVNERLRMEGLSCDVDPGTMSEEDSLNNNIHERNENL